MLCVENKSRESAGDKTRHRGHSKEACKFFDRKATQVSRTTKRHMGHTTNDLANGRLHNSLLCLHWKVELAPNNLTSPYLWGGFRLLRQAALNPTIFLGVQRASQSLQEVKDASFLVLDEETIY